MRYLLFIILFVTSTLTLFSKSKLDSLVSIGNEQSFQFNFIKAEKTFKTIIELFPESSIGYYLISRNSLWFYLANKDSSSKNKFNKFYKIALTKAEKEFENDSENALVNYNLGNIYFLNSIFNSSEKNSMDAFWSTKSALGYFEDAIDLDKNYYAPRLPLGTIQYALGFVPGFLGWAISIAGLEGDKLGGLENIKLAYYNCKSCKAEAAYHLGKIYTEYNAMYDKAEDLLSKIVKEYPQNELFLYQYAILQIDKRQLKKAEEILNHIIYEIPNPNFIQTYALSMFLKGEVLFKQNRFKEAIEEYEHFIAKTSSPDYTGISNLKIALSYEMLNEKLQAQKHYILARNGNLNIAEDFDANERSQKYFDLMFSDNDKLIIKANNFLESGKYLDANETLEKFDTKKMTKEAQFNSDLVKIDAFQNMNKFDKSLDVLNKYKDNSKFEGYKEFPKYLYLKSLQEFNDKKYSDSNDTFKLALNSIHDSDNKLQRLLVNLSMKLAKIKE
ncbi:MAG: tetratricopeptide repeat protein [Bacteroidetes bacterium]|nr:tetratricopeptide repeat protein [Bacteroidota bacterium]MBU1116298.1 tetratricopeptide repeat protein [Bacteroidota bacterium]MBU1797315.1 tetratricopeptide repeat protein [Bacteroidota bacterium]